MKSLLTATLVLYCFSALTQTVIMKDKRYVRDPMEKLVVLTQVPNDTLKELVEHSIFEAFQKKGIPFVNAYDLIRFDTTYYYSTLEREFKMAGADGILIVKLINIEISDMYIFPGDVLPPDAYNYYEYYSVYYYYDLPIVTDSGYMLRQDRTWRIDMNLYANKGDMIVFSAQTNTFDLAEPEKLIKSLGKKLAKIIISDGEIFNR